MRVNAARKLEGRARLAGRAQGRESLGDASGEWKIGAVELCESDSPAEVFLEGLHYAVRREGPVPREENDADGEQNYNRGAEHWLSRQGWWTLRHFPWVYYWAVTASLCLCELVRSLPVSGSNSRSHTAQASCRAANLRVKPGSALDLIHQPGTPFSSKRTRATSSWFLLK